ncbi:hypothetical protein [Salana multivorans]
MSETPFDLDGDGNPDVIEYDYDGDGAADETIIDMDGDGVFETTLIDLDGDGYQETIISVEGETVVIDTDTDGDGDSDVLEVDIDGDGIIDETWIDTDDDGIVDTLVEPSTGEPITDDPVVSDPTTDPGTDVTIEPASSEELVDRGECEAAFWQFQEENGFCAPTSVAIIFSEMFGQTLPKEIFVERAIELGLLDWTADGWSGLDIPSIEQLMEKLRRPCHHARVRAGRGVGGAGRPHRGELRRHRLRRLRRGLGHRDLGGARPERRPPDGPRARGEPHRG